MEIGSKPTGASAALAVGAAGDVNAALKVPAGSRPGWDDVVLRGVAPDGHVLVEELAAAGDAWVTVDLAGRQAGSGRRG